MSRKVFMSYIGADYVEDSSYEFVMKKKRRKG